MPDNKPPAQIADLLTVAEAAELLQLAKDTVRGFILRGLISPVFNVGSERAPRYRIPRDSLLRKFVQVEPFNPG